MPKEEKQPMAAAAEKPESELFITVHIWGSRKSVALMAEELLKHIRYSEAFYGELMGRKRPQVKIYDSQVA